MKTKISMAVICLLMTAPVLADTSDQQSRVMDYCQQVSQPLFNAGGAYVTHLGQNMSPDNAKAEVLKTVTNSESYKKANPAVKQAMDKVVSGITRPEEMKATQQDMMAKGENYLGVHAIVWANINVKPFTAWCNFSRFEG
jgi:uncharacterized protein (DUF1330 family)